MISMGKRGAKPKGKVKIQWSPDFAYAIGLLVTDGCLQNDGRHIELTSKDREQLLNFLKALRIKVRLTQKQSSLGNKYLRVQFGDVLFYRFLLSIGLTPAKSKNIGAVDIPKKYFFDFLRGSFDGDGCTYSYFDPRWKSSFMFYTTFVSASRRHILWLQKKIAQRLRIKGHITGNGDKGSAFQLKYAKSDSLKLLREMYPNKDVRCLSRKRLKIEKMLSIVAERL